MPDGDHAGAGTGKCRDESSADVPPSPLICHGLLLFEVGHQLSEFWSALAASRLVLVQLP